MTKTLRRLPLFQAKAKVSPDISLYILSCRCNAKRVILSEVIVFNQRPIGLPMTAFIGYSLLRGKEVSLGCMCNV